MQNINGVDVEKSLKYGAKAGPRLRTQSCGYDWLLDTLNTAYLLYRSPAVYLLCYQHLATLQALQRRQRLGHKMIRWLIC
jgi:transposase-like protein